MIYFLKHEDTSVIELSVNKEGFVEKINTVFDYKLIPPYILNKDPFSLKEQYINDWITMDKIDSSRENVDKILKRNKVNTTRELFIKNMGLKLTDHYWLCPETYTKTGKIPIILKIILMKKPVKF